MPIGAITGSLARTESSDVGPPIDPSLCDHDRSSSPGPRRLCISRQRRSRRAGRTALLDVHVASCASSCDEPTTALILLSGELSATTLDDSVWDSVMDFAAFARSVVLDLSDVACVDQRGSGMVDALYHVIDGVGGRLSIHNPSSVVEQVLRSCGISDQIVVCHPT
jgi:anti-anti-sigma regulatory factor